MQRRLCAVDSDAERTTFPFVAQIARVERKRGKAKLESVILLTSRPSSQLVPSEWLQANVDHWAIETGLHARLDASRHDDTCRLRRPRSVWVHGMFTRWANSLFMHWRQARATRRHSTTTNFLGDMAADHDRRAVSAVLCKSASW